MRDPMRTKSRKFKTILITAAVLATSVVFASVVWASYTQTTTLNSYFATADSEFYFTSDLLLPDASPIPVYAITHDWQADSEATIRFDLLNYDNSLKISNRAIHYEVETDPAGGAVSGTIAADVPEGNKQTIELDFTNPDPQAPLEVTVTAAATSPYSKVLRGKFIISPAMTYSVNDNEGTPTAILTINLIQSETADTDVVIAWPEGAAPDMTNPIVKTAVNEDSMDLTNRSMTTTLHTAAVYELIFFKDAMDNYNGITVTK